METAPGGPSATTAQIETALLDALHTIRTHWAALLAPGGSSSIAGGNVGRSNDEVTALDRKVSLSHEVTLCLNGWARIIVEDRPLTFGLEGVDPLKNWGRISDTFGLIQILETHARWFSGHEAATDATDELAGYAAKVQAAAAPERRDWQPLGACPLEVEVDAVLQVCGGQVRAYPERLPYCQRCGTEGPRGWWERAMFPEADGHDMVTAEQVVDIVQRAFGGKRAKPDVVRQWVRRYGLVTHPGPDGRSLYNRADVVRRISEQREGTA